MEEKTYKIDVNTTNSLVEHDYFIIKNLDELKQVFANGKKNGKRIKAHNYTLSQYTISESNENIKAVCGILIDLYKKERNYNNCIKYIKNKIIEQYEDEKGADRYFGFKINEELQKIAIKEYRIENFKLDIFCDNFDYISKKIYEIFEKKERFNADIEENKEDDSMELEDFNESIITFTNAIEEKEKREFCCIF